MFGAKTKFFVIGTLFMVLFSCMSRRADAEDPGKKSDDKGQARFYGDVSILTNYIRKGITQTNNDPAFQTGVGYQFSPQFRLGVWGSNVSYDNETTHLNLKAYFRYKFEFTQNVNMLLKYDLDRYYKTSTRNGTVLNLDFIIFDYHIYHIKDDNWEGTDSEVTWWGAGKDFTLTQSLLLELVAGYSLLDIAGMDNYFDFRCGLAYKADPVRISASVTGTSNASQFNGRGNPAITAAIATQF